MSDPKKPIVSDDAIVCSSAVGPQRTDDESRRSSAESRRGWFWPLNSRKAHYFVGGISLCRRMMCFSNDLDDSGATGPDDCAACSKALAKSKKDTVSVPDGR